MLILLFKAASSVSKLKISELVLSSLSLYSPLALTYSSTQCSYDLLSISFDSAILFKRSSHKSITSLTNDWLAWIGAVAVMEART